MTLLSIYQLTLESLIGCDRQDTTRMRSLQVSFSVGLLTLQFLFLQETDINTIFTQHNVLNSIGRNIISIVCTIDWVTSNSKGLK